MRSFGPSQKCVSDTGARDKNFSDPTTGKRSKVLGSFGIYLHLPITVGATHYPPADMYKWHAPLLSCRPTPSSLAIVTDGVAKSLRHFSVSEQRNGILRLRSLFVSHEK